MNFGLIKFFLISNNCVKIFSKRLFIFYIFTKLLRIKNSNSMNRR